MKVDNLVPEVYYKESRDFSYIGRVFELLFNYSKTASELVSINPDNENLNSNIIDLALSTLGFKAKHKYITKDIIAVLASFSEMMKKKGTVSAITLLTQILAAAQQIGGNKTRIEFDVDDRYSINILTPLQMKDFILIEDLLDYILPAGVLYNITRKQSETLGLNTNIGLSTDKVPPEKEMLSNDIVSKNYDYNTSTSGNISTMMISAKTNTKRGKKR